jgi:hypothetical protein
MPRGSHLRLAPSRLPSPPSSSACPMSTMKRRPVAGMRARIATFGVSLAAAFALAAAGSLAGAAAPAEAYYLKSTDEAPDRHLNILRFPPRNPSFRPCIERTVRLRAGRYLNGAYAVSERHRTDPDLAEEIFTVRSPGVYAWEACRGWNAGLRDYQIRSTLRRGGPVASTILNTFSRDLLAEPDGVHVYGPGNYEWGGRIVRLTLGVTTPSG